MLIVPRADNTHLTFASNNLTKIDNNYLVNEDLASANQCLIINKNLKNQSKTEFMLIGSRQRLTAFLSIPHLVIDDTLL